MADFASSLGLISYYNHLSGRRCGLLLSVKVAWPVQYKLKLWVHWSDSTILTSNFVVIYGCGVFRHQPCPVTACDESYSYFPRRSLRTADWFGRNHSSVQNRKLHNNLITNVNGARTPACYIIRTIMANKQDSLRFLPQVFKHKTQKLKRRIRSARSDRFELLKIMHWRPLHYWELVADSKKSNNIWIFQLTKTPSKQKWWLEYNDPAGLFSCLQKLHSTKMDLYTMFSRLAMFLDEFPTWGDSIPLQRLFVFIWISFPNVVLYNETFCST